MFLLALRYKFPEETQGVKRGPGSVWYENGTQNGEKSQDSSFFKIKRKIAELKGKTKEQALIKENKCVPSPSTYAQSQIISSYSNIDIYNKSEHKALKFNNSEHVIIENVEESNEVPDVFAPIGRLLKCELINTIDSCNVETPIIGIVTEDLYWNGHLIIPANTEVHGIAKTTKVHQKIASGNLWQLVLPKENGRPNGAILDLKGVALDREESPGTLKTFGLTDGSFGISGYHIMSTAPEEIKMFIASFAQGMLSGLQTRAPYSYGVMGSVLQNTLKNASLEGTATVMAEYIKELQREIEEKGFYTRVPAGKQFYLYITERIEPAKAYFKKIKHDGKINAQNIELDA